MNRTLITAAVALMAFAGTAAMADEQRDQATPSTLTRAEVQAELAQARADGSLYAPVDLQGNVQPMVQARVAAGQPVSTLSRVEVRRELARSQVQRDANWLLGESYGAFAPTLASDRTREAVRAEAVAAARQQSAQLLRDYGG